MRRRYPFAADEAEAPSTPPRKRAYAMDPASMAPKPSSTRADGSPEANYIGQLQVFLSQRGHSLPKYDDMGHTGPDHNKTFTMRVTVRDVSHEGTGRSKKEAKRNAAKAMLEEICATVGVNDRAFSSPKKPSTTPVQSPLAARMSPNQQSPLATSTSFTQQGSPLAARISPNQGSSFAGNASSSHSPLAAIGTPHRRVATNLTDHPAFYSPQSVDMDSPSHHPAPRDEEAEMIAATYLDLLRPFDRCVRRHPDLKQKDDLEMSFEDLLTSSADSGLVSYVDEKKISAHFVAMGSIADDGSALCVLHLKPTKITTHGCGSDVASARYEAVLSAMHYLATMRPWVKLASE